MMAHPYRDAVSPPPATPTEHRPPWTRFRLTLDQTEPLVFMFCTLSLMFMASRC